MKRLLVDKGKLTSDDGKETRLRGLVLNGAVNIESHVAGFPGYESKFRTALSCVMGEDKAAFFFEHLSDNFMSENDFKFMKALGINTIRVEINYKHLVSDTLFKTYRQMGFRYLDHITQLADKYGMYVILDLNVAPGWQDPDWHTDNPYQANTIWYSEILQRDAARIWEEIASRYADDPVIASYVLMNEPVAPNSESLIRVYKSLITCIRKHDPYRIITIQGNMYSYDLTGLNVLVDDDNTMLEMHYFPLPGFNDCVYPGDVPPNRRSITKQFYDKGVLEREFLQMVKQIIDWRKPVYVGNFGSVFWNTKNDVYRPKVTEDLIQIFENHGFNWTLSCYKDYFPLGLTYLDPNSEYMNKFGDLIRLRNVLGADEVALDLSKLVDKLALSFKESLVEELRNSSFEYVEPIMNLEGGILGEEARIAYSYDSVVRRAMSMLVNHYLTVAFAERFNGMSYDELDKLTRSFNVLDCIKRTELTSIVSRYCKS